MKKLAMILAIAICQALYAEYLYDEGITTDTGESIKAHQYSKRFDGQCVEMREGIVESKEDKTYNKLYKEDKQEVLKLYKESQAKFKIKNR